MNMKPCKMANQHQHFRRTHILHINVDGTGNRVQCAQGEYLKENLNHRTPIFANYVLFFN
jgi:hypothetical protein